MNPIASLFLMASITAGTGTSSDGSTERDTLAGGAGRALLGYRPGDFELLARGGYAPAAVLGGFVVEAGPEFVHMELIGIESPAPVGVVDITSDQKSRTLRFDVLMGTGEGATVSLVRSSDAQGAPSGAASIDLWYGDRAEHFLLQGCTPEDCSGAVRFVDGFVVSADAYEARMRQSVRAFTAVTIPARLLVKEEMVWDAQFLGWLDGGSWLDCAKDCIDDCGGTHNGGTCDTLTWSGDTGAVICAQLCTAGCSLAHPFSLLGCAAALLF